jgi:hypothetical protein
LDEGPNPDPAVYDKAKSKAGPFKAKNWLGKGEEWERNANYRLSKILGDDDLELKTKFEKFMTGEGDIRNQNASKERISTERMLQQILTTEDGMRALFNMYTNKGIDPTVPGAKTEYNTKTRTPIIDAIAAQNKAVTATSNLGAAQDVNQLGALNRNQPLIDTTLDNKAKLGATASGAELEDFPLRRKVGNFALQNTLDQAAIDAAVKGKMPLSPGTTVFDAVKGVELGTSASKMSPEVEYWNQSRPAGTPAIPQPRSTLPQQLGGKVVPIPSGERLIRKYDPTTGKYILMNPATNQVVE